MNNEKQKLLSPLDLAVQLADEALTETNGDAAEAYIRVLMYLAETLGVVATMASDGDEVKLKRTLKFVGAKIVEMPIHPAAAVLVETRQRLQEKKGP